MAKALIAPPVGLPVTLASIKEHLRVDTDAEDGYLLGLASAATAHVESATGKVLLAQTWRIYLDTLPNDGVIVLPVAPVISLPALTLYDVQGDPVLIGASGYDLHHRQDPPSLALHALPSRDQYANGIEIDVVAGFGEAGTDVPDQLLRAILVLCAHWHAFRGSASDASPAGLAPKGLDALLGAFRQVRL